MFGLTERQQLALLMSQTAGQNDSSSLPTCKPSPEQIRSSNTSVVTTATPRRSSTSTQASFSSTSAVSTVSTTPIPLTPLSPGSLPASPVTSSTGTAEMHRRLATLNIVPYPTPASVSGPTRPRQSRSLPPPIWLPQPYELWPIAKQQAWNDLPRDPSAFYYEYLPPGEAASRFNWSPSERAKFLRYLTLHPSQGQWGYFSLHFPGRTGKQCERFYNQLQAEKQLGKEKGKSTQAIVGKIEKSEIPVDDLTLIKNHAESVKKHPNKSSPLRSLAISTVTVEVSRKLAVPMLDDEDVMSTLVPTFAPVASSSSSITPFASSPTQVSVSALVSKMPVEKTTSQLANRDSGSDSDSDSNSDSSTSSSSSSSSSDSSDSEREEAQNANTRGSAPLSPLSPREISARIAKVSRSSKLSKIEKQVKIARLERLLKITKKAAASPKTMISPVSTTATTIVSTPKRPLPITNAAPSLVTLSMSRGSSVASPFSSFSSLAEMHDTEGICSPSAQQTPAKRPKTSSMSSGTPKTRLEVVGKGFPETPFTPFTTSTGVMTTNTTTALILPSPHTNASTNDSHNLKTSAKQEQSHLLCPSGAPTPVSKKSSFSANVSRIAVTVSAAAMTLKNTDFISPSPLPSPSIRHTKGTSDESIKFNKLEKPAMSATKAGNANANPVRILSLPDLYDDELDEVSLDTKVVESVQESENTLANELNFALTRSNGVSDDVKKVVHVDGIHKDFLPIEAEDEAEATEEEEEETIFCITLHPTIPSSPSATSVTSTPSTFSPSLSFTSDGQGRDLNLNTSLGIDEMYEKVNNVANKIRDNADNYEAGEDNDEDEDAVRRRKYVGSLPTSSSSFSDIIAEKSTRAHLHSHEHPLASMKVRNPAHISLPVPTSVFNPVNERLICRQQFPPGKTPNLNTSLGSAKSSALSQRILLIPHPAHTARADKIKPATKTAPHTVISLVHDEAEDQAMVVRMTEMDSEENKGTSSDKDDEYDEYNECPFQSKAWNSSEASVHLAMSESALLEARLHAQIQENERQKTTQHINRGINRGNSTSTGNFRNSSFQTACAAISAQFDPASAFSSDPVMTTIISAPWSRSTSASSCSSFTNNSGDQVSTTTPSSVLPHTNGHAIRAKAQYNSRTSVLPLQTGRVYRVLENALDIMSKNQAAFTESLQGATDQARNHQQTKQYHESFDSISPSYSSSAVVSDAGKRYRAVTIDQHSASDISVFSSQVKSLYMETLGYAKARVVGATQVAAASGGSKSAATNLSRLLSPNSSFSL